MCPFVLAAKRTAPTDSMRSELGRHLKAFTGVFELVYTLLMFVLTSEILMFLSML